jgi:hypothetical protein
MATARLVGRATQGKKSNAPEVVDLDPGPGPGSVEAVHIRERKSEAKVHRNGQTARRRTHARRCWEWE